MTQVKKTVSVQAIIKVEDDKVIKEYISNKMEGKLTKAERIAWAFKNMAKLIGSGKVK